MNLFRKPGLLVLFLGAFLFSSVLVSCDNDDDDDDMSSTNYALSGTASGAAERPNPVTTSASGDISGTFNPDTKVLSYAITWNGLSGPPSNAHFHGPAGVNDAAGVALPITLPSGAGTTGSLTGTATLNSTQETQLLAGQWYYNLHTAANPGGEIRGQVSATR